MLDFVVRILINAIALVAAVRLVPGAEFVGDWWRLAVLAAVFGLVNAYLRPIVKLLSLPLTLVSFGLVGLIINTAMVLVSAAISDNLHLGFTLGDWPPGAIEIDTLVAAFLTALVISVVSTILALFRRIVPGV